MFYVDVRKLRAGGGVWQWKGFPPGRALSRMAQKAQKLTYNDRLYIKQRKG